MTGHRRKSSQKIETYLQKNEKRLFTVENAPTSCPHEVRHPQRPDETWDVLPSEPKVFVVDLRCERIYSLPRVVRTPAVENLHPVAPVATREHRSAGSELLSPPQPPTPFTLSFRCLELGKRQNENALLQRRFRAAHAQRDDNVPCAFHRVGRGLTLHDFEI